MYPAQTEVGLTDDTLGTTLPTLNDREFETGAPEEPFRTVMVAEPAEAISVAGTAAVRCVPESRVVASSTPFHRTTEPDEPVTKFVPLTPKLNAAAPTTAEAGSRELIVGVGALIVNGNWSLVPDGMSRRTSPGLNTVTCAVPGVVSADAGTCAVSTVAELKSVGTETPLNMTAERRGKGSVELK
jgi:hypothetical protein